MAKGIKKFDQEIRVVGNWLSLQNIETGTTTADYGALYTHLNEPWFANNTTSWKLASDVDVQQNATDISTNAGNITTNATNISTNATNIATLSTATFTISNGVGAGYDIGFDDSITLSAGTDISISEDGNGKFTISNIAAASDNFYLDGATISNGDITFSVNGTTDVTLDLKEKLDLGMLSNVATGSTQDGDFLIWNSATTQWESSGLTEDSLVAGAGINFDTGVQGQVTIESILAGTGGTWRLNADNITPDHRVEYEDTIIFSGGTNMTVNYDAGTGVLEFVNDYANNYTYEWSLNTIGVANGQDVTIQGTLSEIDVDTSSNILTLSLNSTVTDDIANSITGVSFDSTENIETLTFYLNDDSTITQSLNDVWVRNDGDSMSGDYFLSGNLTITGDTLLIGDLYISGTTVTVDTENLTVADNIIEVNANQTGSLGVTNRTAGLIVNRGDLSAYTFAFYEDDVNGLQVGEREVFRIGETTSDASGNIIDMSETQVVATRQESNLISDNDLMFWNSSKSRLDPISGTTGPGVNDVALFNGTEWTYHNASAIVDGANSWNTISGDTGSITTTQPNQQMSIVGGDLISTTALTSTITISHDKLGTAYTNPTLNTNDFISSLTVDEYGHISSASVTSVDFSSYYTVTYIEDHFLNTGTSYFTTISADTTSYTASESGETLTIVGGTGIDTSIDTNGVLTISSVSSENMISDTMGTTSTILSVDFGAAKVIIIDYYMENGQEGQIRYLADGTEFTHDYQGTDISISDVLLSSGTLTLTHDSVTSDDDFKYYYKTIL